MDERCLDGSLFKGFLGNICLVVQNSCHHVATIDRRCFGISRSNCFDRCRATEMFSTSESESWFSDETARFLLSGAINLNICLWFSANIFDRSEKNSFLKYAFISFRSSGSVPVVLLLLATKFSARLFSFKEVSNSLDTSSVTAFLFWLLVVIFRVEGNIEL